MTLKVLFPFVLFFLKFYSWARNRASFQEDFVGENWTVGRSRELLSSGSPC